MNMEAIQTVFSEGKTTQEYLHALTQIQYGFLFKERLDGLESDPLNCLTMFREHRCFSYRDSFELIIIMSKNYVRLYEMIQHLMKLALIDSKVGSIEIPHPYKGMLTLKSISEDTSWRRIDQDSLWAILFHASYQQMFNKMPSYAARTLNEYIQGIREHLLMKEHLGDTFPVFTDINGEIQKDLPLLRKIRKRFNREECEALFSWASRNNLNLQEFILVVKKALKRTKVEKELNLLTYLTLQ